MIKSFLVSVLVVLCTGIFAQQPDWKKRQGAGGYGDGQSPFKVTGQVLDAKTVNHWSM